MQGTVTVANAGTSGIPIRLAVWEPEALEFPMIATKCSVRDGAIPHFAQFLHRRGIGG